MNGKLQLGVWRLVGGKETKFYFYYNNIQCNTQYTSTLLVEVETSPSQVLILLSEADSWLPSFLVYRRRRHDKFSASIGN